MVSEQTQALALLASGSQKETLAIAMPYLLIGAGWENLKSNFGDIEDSR